MLKLPHQTRSRRPRLLQIMSRWLFSISKNRDSTTSLGNLCHSLATCTPNKTFLNVQRDSPVVRFLPAASHPVMGHHWKEPGFIFFAPSLQTAAHIAEISQSLLWAVTTLSAFPYRRDALSINHLSIPFFNSIQYVHVSLEVAQNRTQ